MKKYLLLIVLQVFALGIWAQSEPTDRIVFEYQNADSSTGMENQVPITGGVKDNNLNLYYKGNDYASVLVKDKNGSTVYQNYMNGTSQKTINLNGYNQGNYTIKVEDSKGNSAVGNFQVKK